MSYEHVHLVSYWRRFRPTNLFGNACQTHRKMRSSKIRVMSFRSYESSKTNEDQDEQDEDCVHTGPARDHRSLRRELALVTCLLTLLLPSLMSRHFSYINIICSYICPIARLKRMLTALYAARRISRRCGRGWEPE